MRAFDWKCDARQRLEAVREIGMVKLWISRGIDAAVRSRHRLATRMIVPKSYAARLEVAPRRR
jgi:hypothetical protein